MKIYVVTKETLFPKGEDDITEIICAYTWLSAALNRIKKENAGVKILPGNSLAYYTYTEVELLSP